MVVSLKTTEARRAEVDEERLHDMSGVRVYSIEVMSFISHFALGIENKNKKAKLKEANKSKLKQNKK